MDATPAAAKTEVGATIPVAVPVPVAKLCVASLARNTGPSDVVVIAVAPPLTEKNLPY